MLLIAVYLGLTVHYAMILACAVRILTRPDREPASRVAWLLVISVLPFLGVFLYLLFGELSIARKARGRMSRLSAALPNHPPAGFAAEPVREEPPEGVPEPRMLARVATLFERAAAVNGFAPMGGNSVALMADSAGAVDGIIADIAAARDHVHLYFYIWLADGNGLRVAEALKAAAARGIACRVMVDGMGSRRFLRHPVWAELAAAGVETGVAFPIRWPVLRMFVARVDIRNHRKMVVIDNRIAYVGSQNCADAEFAVKKRFGPWVDVMARAEGPVAWQQQQLFVTDWITHTGRRIEEILQRPVAPGEGTALALAYGTGPTVDVYAVSDIFQLAAAAARRELVISTPYYVPTEALNQAIRSAALRGVRVRMLLPARNDSRFVALASRSYYVALIRAGVEIREFSPGLLHAKTVMVDGHTAVIGSANMDRRSFELNYENNMIVEEPGFALALRGRQEEWSAASRPVTLAEVEGWRLGRRALQNLAAAFGPLL